MNFSKLFVFFTSIFLFCGSSEIKDDKLSHTNTSLTYGSWNIVMDSVHVSTGFDGTTVSAKIRYSSEIDCFADNLKYTLRLKCRCSSSPIAAYSFSYYDGDEITCLETSKSSDCSLFDFYYGCGVVDTDNYRVVSYHSVDIVYEWLGIDVVWMIVICAVVLIIILVSCIWCCCYLCHCCCYNKKLPEFYITSDYTQI